MHSRIRQPRITECAQTPLVGWIGSSGSQGGQAAGSWQRTQSRALRRHSPPASSRLRSHLPLPRRNRLPNCSPKESSPPQPSSSCRWVALYPLGTCATHPKRSIVLVVALG